MTQGLAAGGATAALALLCAVALFVGINVIADKTLRSERIDLTQQKLYTLADGSKKMIAKIDEPLTFRFYFSKRLGDEIPTYGLYAQRVRELLQEYEALSGGRIKLEEQNPVPYSPVEDRADLYVAIDQLMKGLVAEHDRIERELKAKHSKEELKELLKGQIEQEHNGLTRTHMKRKLLDQLAAAHDFDVPPSMVEAEFNQIWAQLQHEASHEEDPEAALKEMEAEKEG